MKTSTQFFGLITAAIIAIAGLSCSNSGDAITKDTYGIILKGYTAMRIDPMIFSGIVTELNKGTSVQVLEKSREQSWVGKTSGYWYKVSTKEGLTGWVFGPNISIYSSKSKDSMNRVVSSFMNAEHAQIKQYLMGKWWSTNEFGDFTDHCLELYESEKYKSYMKGNEEKPIVGAYKLDFNKNEIVFSNGTSFKHNLSIAKRGNDYIIKKSMKDFELRFTKISIETSPEPEIKATGKKKPAGTGDVNKTQ
ncbi:MAG: SH3 domain-containing protein [Spirochaetes bacterium]|nr:SH3 domain-containing protein [Spirochaetota bacterium]